MSPKNLEDFARAPITAELKDQELTEEMERRGWVVHKPQPPKEPIVLDTSRLRGDRIRLGIISDSHIGSKFSQPTYLREHARYMRKRGCTAILLPGDVTDGAVSMHPGFVYETWAQGADAQRDAAIRLLPDVGIPWYVIGGNHDASHFKASGYDIVAAICAARDDLHYLGPEQDSRNARGSVGYLQLGDVLIQMCHPHTPGTRTRSYRLETWIENQNAPRPHITVMGNFHKYVDILYRNTWGIMVPSFQSQSAWMASKAIESQVGSVIIEFGVNTKGLAPLLHVEPIFEFIPRERDW